MPAKACGYYNSARIRYNTGVINMAGVRGEVLSLNVSIPSLGYTLLEE
jgi:hypothetical protein